MCPLGFKLSLQMQVTMLPTPQAFYNARLHKDCAAADNVLHEQYSTHDPLLVTQHRTQVEQTSA